ncbi:NIPSNAP family protein [Solibacillus sp. CAU 1738]|uniref:NIPSNAP family protein n=1 Tax=Solibacillus sp. CAU 1738 TaxID=3140363 RepID=UPI0032604D6E
MFYRRKFYVVKPEFINIFNDHFNQTNLPNQLKYGAKLVGRWMAKRDDGLVEIFAIWEYESYEKYEEIEKNVINDKAHVQRIHDWYEKHGGKENVYKKYILEVRNEEIFSTLNL